MNKRIRIDYIQKFTLLMIFSMSAFELSAQLQNYSTRLKAHVNASEVYGEVT